MDPENMMENKAESGMEEAPGQDAGNTPQFQLLLRTTQGDFVIAASDTVNDLVDKARYWMNATDTGAQLLDSQVRSVILQELDPKTGAYVDSTELPVKTKQQIIQQARTIGAR